MSHKHPHLGRNNFSVGISIKIVKSHRIINIKSDYPGQNTKGWRNSADQAARVKGIDR